jgi:uncharacterized protein YeaO (DUF488 family)
MTLYTERVYDDGGWHGAAFFVERLWPRGVSKEQLADAVWCKDVAPSSELRKWYGHMPERWPEFRKRYTAELKDNAAAMEPIIDAAKRGDVTLLYAARDTERNGAVVLAEVLRRQLR